MLFAAVALLLVQADTAEYAWRVTDTDHGPVLSEGDPQSAMIQMRCIRPGVVRTYLAGLYTGDGPEPRRVTVSSVRARAGYRLRYRADSAGGFSADIPVGSGPIMSFARNGRLTVAAAGSELSGDVTTAEELQIVAGFLLRCRGPT